MQYPWPCSLNELRITLKYSYDKDGYLEIFNISYSLHSYSYSLFIVLSNELEIFRTYKYYPMVSNIITCKKINAAKHLAIL